MLAAAEPLVIDGSLDWAFCDTDSMAIAKPENMEESEFLDRAWRVQSWFTSLNPYKAGGSLLREEDVNQPPRDCGQGATPLYCYAVSAKRYVLFNLDADGHPIIRKASAHGLGHLLPPYDEASAPVSIPAPANPLTKIGVQRWQHDVWYRIFEAELKGHRDQSDFDSLPGSHNPAVGRYTATSPHLLRWFKNYNEPRDYTDQVKPFGFMHSYQADKVVAGRGVRRGRLKHPKPMAPYATPPSAALDECFDRETGESVTATS